MNPSQKKTTVNPTSTPHPIPSNSDASSLDVQKELDDMEKQINQIDTSQLDPNTFNF